MQSNVRDPKVRNVQFITLQPPVISEDGSSLTVAVFREELPYTPPNLPQPTNAGPWISSPISCMIASASRC